MTMRRCVDRSFQVARAGTVKNIRVAVLTTRWANANPPPYAKMLPAKHARRVAARRRISRQVRSRIVFGSQDEDLRPGALTFLLTDGPRSTGNPHHPANGGRFRVVSFGFSASTFEKEKHGESDWPGLMCGEDREVWRKCQEGRRTFTLPDHDYGGVVGHRPTARPS